MTTTETEAQALLGRIAAGQEAALAEFYQVHQARVFRYAQSKLNDSFAAADILNEVMLEVWKSAGRFEGRAKVSTWLLGIAHHKVVDYFRREKRHQADELDESLEDESPGVQLEQLLAGLQDTLLVRDCMARLSADHREVLHLAFFEDLNYAEIAEITQVPEGTVKSRVFHAKNLLKQQLIKVMARP